MGRTLHFIDRLSTGSGSLLAHGTTTNFDINLSDPDELPHNNTLTCQVAILYNSALFFYLRSTNA